MARLQLEELGVPSVAPSLHVLDPSLTANVSMSLSTPLGDAEVPAIPAERLSFDQAVPGSTVDQCTRTLIPTAGGGVAAAAGGGAAKDDVLRTFLHAQQRQILDAVHREHAKTRECLLALRRDMLDHPTGSDRLPSQRSRRTQSDEECSKISLSRSKDVSAHSSPCNCDHHRDGSHPTSQASARSRGRSPPMHVDHIKEAAPPMTGASTPPGAAAAATADFSYPSITPGSPEKRRTHSTNTDGGSATNDGPSVAQLTRRVSFSDTPAAIETPDAFYSSAGKGDKGEKSRRNSSTVPSCAAQAVELDLVALQEVKGWSTVAASKTYIWDTPPINGDTVSRVGKTLIEVFIVYISTGLVIANTVFIGIQANYTLEARIKNCPTPAWVAWGDIIFPLCFCLELLARLLLFRKAFFQGPDRAWNFFETLLVISSITEWVIEVLDFSILRAVRIFRLIRVARMVRIVRWLRDLRHMVASIVCSFTSLAWAIAFLIFLIYIFAVFILMDVHENYNEIDDTEKVVQLYGNLWEAMLSLFMAITGGEDWQRLLQPLRSISKYGYVCFFCFYVGFVVLGIMNILTAIFVERARNVADIDRDLVIQEQIAQQNSVLNQLKAVFRAADTTGTGTISQQELEMLLQDGAVVAYLQYLELDVQEARGLFRLLDIDAKGEVSIDEIVMGMMRLKGSATSIDFASLMYENKKVFVRLQALMEYVEASFSTLETSLATTSSNPARERESIVRYTLEHYVEEAQRQVRQKEVDERAFVQVPSLQDNFTNAKSLGPFNRLLPHSSYQV